MVRRGNALPDGTIVPKRPFNNRANTSKRPHKHSRVSNQLKKMYYGQLRAFRSRTE